jgi:dTDP-4-amino-4,6-dideoxygalactose transaminase
MSEFLALRKSLMPSADDLLPYLREIDDNRWYSNFGALSLRFEKRLAEHFGVDPENVIALCNGTAGLTLSLQSIMKSESGLCLVPSFTFAASPAAIVNAGLSPYFSDINRDSWILTPDIAEEALEKAPFSVTAVMPVSPFGAPLESKGWEDFTERTGIPIVLDAAWAFDNVQASRIPAIISLHVTKVMGIGEGGLVVSLDRDLVSEVRQRANFGFGSDRHARFASGNSKLSEYAAAVGLAAMDNWPKLRDSSLALAAIYADYLSNTRGLRTMPGLNDGHARAACAVEFDAPVAVQVSEYLEKEGIESRCWWGEPCHRHSAFTGFPCLSMDNTEDLCARMLNLPFFPEMSEKDVRRVCDSVEKAIKMFGQGGGIDCS